MNTLKQSAAGFLSIVSLSMLALAGCAVDTASDTGDDEVTADDNATSAEDAVVGGGCALNTSVTTANDLLNNSTTGIRHLLGMPALTCDSFLKLASEKHATYVATNANEFGHVEIAGHPNFYAAAFYDRDAKAGFTSNVSGEVIYGNNNVSDSLIGQYGWMNSVFHRIAFTTYQNDRYGVGAAAKTVGTSNVTADFGKNGASPAAGFIATWPVSNATGVQKTFNCLLEGPSPCNSSTAGSPISLIYGSNIGTVSEHTIKLNSQFGAAVGHTVIGHTAFPGYIPSNMVFLLPNASLSASTKYCVHIKAQIGTTTSSFTRDWCFTTKA